MGFCLFGNESSQMKLIPFVIVTLLVTIAMGVGVAPLTGAVDGGGQADAVDVSPSYATATTTATGTTQTEPTATANGDVLNVLALPTEAVERSDLRRQYADIGPATGFDTGATTDRLTTRSLEAELEATASDQERRERISTELTEIETEIIDLEDRERQAIQAFSDGDLEPRELLIEIATVHLKAAALRDRTNMLADHADETDIEAISNDRLQRIEQDIRMREGPVRSHAASVLRAERPANRIMIETGGDEIALSAIDDGMYLREVHRNGLRGSGTPDLSADQPEEITKQQYPILWDRGDSWSLGESVDVFMMAVDIPNGELRTFIDRVSGQTFIEHQRIHLSSINTGESTNKVQDRLNVTVDQTHAGGPLRVTVTDAETDEPVAATVTVGQAGEESQTIGTVDQDGAIWAVSPREQFTITVLGEGTSAAFVDITPPSPESVTGSQ